MVRRVSKMLKILDNSNELEEYGTTNESRILRLHKIMYSADFTQYFGHRLIPLESLVHYQTYLHLTLFHHDSK